MNMSTQEAFQAIRDALNDCTPRNLSASALVWLDDWVRNGTGKDHVSRADYIASEEGADGVLALCDTIAAVAGPFLSEASRIARVVSKGKHGKEITPTMLYALARVMGYSYTWGCNDDLRPDLEPEFEAVTSEVKA